MPTTPTLPDFKPPKTSAKEMRRKLGVIAQSVEESVVKLLRTRDDPAICDHTKHGDTMVCIGEMGIAWRVGALDMAAYTVLFGLVIEMDIADAELSRLFREKHGLAQPHVAAAEAGS